jgi:hypothetical protein
MEDKQAVQQHMVFGDGRGNSEQHAVPITGPTSPNNHLPAAIENGQSKKTETSNEMEPSTVGKEDVHHDLTDGQSAADVMPFPRLCNDVPSTPKPTGPELQSDDEDEEPPTIKSFARSMSPASAAYRNRDAVYEKVGEDGVCQMHRFSLYETASRYYLVGADVGERKFRILKIDRTADSGELSIAEDDIVYNRKEMNQLLNAVDDGNKATGGLKLRCSIWGLLGFIRFTGTYYMLLVTKRSQIAMIGGHYIYKIDATELVSLTMPSSRFKLDRDPEEARFIGILNNLDLSRSFYFSYSYDITRTLQHNILRERQNLQRRTEETPSDYRNSMFIWNQHLLAPATSALKNTYDWCLPIVHGFVDQTSNAFLIYLICPADQLDSSQSLWTNGTHHPYCQKVAILCWRPFPEAWSERLGKDTSPRRTRERG